MTAPTREATPAAANRDAPAEPPIASTADHQARIKQLKEQLAALPVPLPGEGPHLPWYRLRQQIEGQLWTELDNKVWTATEARATAIGAIDWIPVRGITVAWVDSWTPAISYGQTAAVLHLIPTPQVPVSQRTLSLLDDTMTRLVRDEELVDAGVGLTHAFPGDDVVIEADTPAPIDGSEVKMGEFLGGIRLTVGVSPMRSSRTLGTPTTMRSATASGLSWSQATEVRSRFRPNAPTMPLFGWTPNLPSMSQGLKAQACRAPRGRC